MQVIRGPGQRRPKPLPYRTPAFRPETPEEFLPPRAGFLYWHLYWLAEHDQAQPSLARLSADLRMPKNDISLLLRRMEEAGAIRAHRGKVYRDLPGILWIEITATAKRTRSQGDLRWPIAQPNRAGDAQLLKPPATSRAGHGR